LEPFPVESLEAITDKILNTKRFILFDGMIDKEQIQIIISSNVLIAFEKELRKDIIKKIS
jgi:chemotaxis methyl-accepting protein methylase